MAPGPSNHNPQQLDFDTTDPGSVTTSQFQDLLERFLRKFNVTSYPVPDTALMEFTLAHCLDVAKRQGLDNARMSAIAEQAVAIVLCIFPFHPKNLQEYISLYTAYFFIMEDLGSSFVENIQTFRQDVIFRRPQLPVFEAWAKLQLDLDNYFDLFVADMIWKGSLDTISAMGAEFALNGHFSVNRVAALFPGYFREKTSFSEAYVYLILAKELFPNSLPQFIQAVPELQRVGEGTNDLMSFYKESESKEDFNFVRAYAVSHGITQLQTLEHIADQIFECADRARAIVAADPLLLKFVDAWINGCVTFQIVLPRRYLLSELEILKDVGMQHVKI